MEDQAFALRSAGVGVSTGVAQGSRRLRCVAIGSGKGGVGKTMVSVGLGYCLAKTGFRVLIMDADLGLANVDLQVGMDPKFTLQDVIFGRSSLEDAVVNLSCGLSILPAASGAQEMVNMGGARRQMFADELLKFAGRYEYLIIDAAAGIGQDVTTFLSAAPEVMVVVANEPTSLMDAYALVKTLAKTSEAPLLACVINMVKTVEEGVALAGKLNTITERFLGMRLPVAGIVPYDGMVGDAIRARKPIPVFAPNCPAALALEKLAKQVSSGGSYTRAAARSGKSVFDKLVSLGMEDVEKV